MNDEPQWERGASLRSIRDFGKSILIFLRPNSIEDEWGYPRVELGEAEAPCTTEEELNDNTQ